MAAQKVAEAVSPDRADIVIGHDILALISSAMYTEPLTVYRELIQNAADAVDEAMMTGALPEKHGRVDIMIDPLHRSIIARDNGTGVPANEFAVRMCSIGASRKRGTNARGFRGIGRLVGLGYCQELVFRSRGCGGERILEAAWDCRALREALQSSMYTSSLSDLVASVVTITSRRASSDDPPHFFEVELRKIVRLGNDALLNATLVRRYLGEVAPVPFHPSFSHGSAIANHLRSQAGYSTIAIRINGESDVVTRPYRDMIVLSATKATALAAPSFFEVPAQDGTSGAVGWIAHHEYLGAFPRTLRVRGLRARVSNLQIGDESCFDGVFAEPRFNQWTIGEVHVIDQRIVANGRRDYFEPSLHFENLCNHLATHARDVGRRCRYLSVRRRRERSLVELEDALTAYTKLIRRNRVARILRDELIDDVKQQIQRTRRQLSPLEQSASQFARVEARIIALALHEKRIDGRATQRQMGQADVLRLLREHIPGGVAISTKLLKLLAESSKP